MPAEVPQEDRIPTEHLARGCAAIALAAVGVIHVIDLPDTLLATPLIGYGYFLLIAATLVGAAVLMTVQGRSAWAAAITVAAGAMLAYVLSRTTGLPTDDLDIGNWNCTLGIAAVSTEALIVLLAVWRMQPDRLLITAFLRSEPADSSRAIATADSTG